MKKIFLFSIVIFLVLMLALFLYNLFFVKKDIKFEDDFNNEKKAESKITSILNDNVISPFLLNDEIYYISDNEKKGLKIDLNGNNKRELFEVDFNNFTGFIWHPQKNEGILEIQEGEWRDYIYLNYENGDKLSYDKNITSISWLDEEGNVVYEYYDSQKNQSSLSIADKKGDNWKKITDLEEKGVIFNKNINEEERIFFWKSGSADIKSELKFFINEQEKVESLGIPRQGADFLPSKDGKKALVSSIEGESLTLGIINEDEEYINLKIPTFIQKTVWSKDGRTVYYALPLKYSDSDFLMPDDYKNREIFTSDSFWRVDVNSGKKERLVELDEIEGEFDATELFLSESERYLFFINRKDGKLYRLEL